jgi:hypothetical protein
VYEGIRPAACGYARGASARAGRPAARMGAGVQTTLPSFVCGRRGIINYHIAPTSGAEIAAQRGAIFTKGLISRHTRGKSEGCVVAPGSRMVVD